jgi:two-component system chemotaxis response regulator CheB
MVSSLTEAGADITLNALEIGAVDFVAKPKLNVERGLRSYAEEITGKVRAASRARVRTSQYIDQTGALARSTEKPNDSRVSTRPTDRLIAIGASTGGTEAIREVLEQFPADAPGVVIVQHIPELFAGPFARRLDGSSALRVALAEDGQVILRGHAYLAPGNQHLRVERKANQFICRLDSSEPVNRHKPSVDVLFHSVVKEAGAKAVGVLLTGMGADGAVGLKAMRSAGAHTIAQDENTSVVWGMPGQAVKLGAAVSILPLGQVAGQTVAYAQR